VIILPATKLHTIQLALTLREADVAEVRALGFGRLDACFLSWKSSTICRALVHEGEVVAIAGAAVERDGVRHFPYRAPAQVWLLTSTLVEQHPMAFHRAMKQLLLELRTYVTVAWNRVDARYTKALTWLRALGFVIHAPLPRPTSLVPFHLVTKEL
jgi:hypothetical protein